MSTSAVVPKIVLDESQMAKAIDMSVHFLRKDRRTRRLIPFYKIGGAVRYDIGRVREALKLLEEGGTRRGAKAKQ